MNGLVLSCVLHLLHTFYSFWKVPKFTIHNIISLWFSIVVIIGIISVSTGIYQTVHFAYSHSPYLPYILEYVGFIIFMWPFRYLNNNDLPLLNMPTQNKNLKNYINILLVLFILYFIVYFNVFLYISQFELVESYSSLHDSGETLYQFNPIEDKIVYICGSAFRWFSPLVLIYGIHIMIIGGGKNERLKAYASIFLVLGCKFLHLMSRGGRGGTFWFSILLFLVFVPFYKRMSNQSKKVIKRGFPLILIIFFIYTLGMSIQRTQNSNQETPFTQVIRYLGEPYPHLGNAFWNQVKVHPMGARMFPMVIDSKYGQLEESYNYSEIWGLVTGVPILNYPTMYGDFYVEFGAIGALIAIFFYALILYLFVRKKPFTFSKYPIIYLYLQIAVTGPYWFNQRGTTGFTAFIWTISMYFIIENILIKKNIFSKNESIQS